MKTFFNIFVVFLRLKKEEFLNHDWQGDMEICLFILGIFVGLIVLVVISCLLAIIIPVLIAEDILRFFLFAGLFGTILSFATITFKNFLCDNWKKATEEVMSKSIE